MNLIFTLLCFLLSATLTAKCPVEYLDESYTLVEKDRQQVSFPLDTNNLMLESGQIYLHKDNNLIPLKFVEYTNQGVYGIADALVLVCPDCGNWYILGYMHTCNGELK